MRYAAIDIGTNTIRLLIAQILEGCRLKFLYQKSKIARLGEGLSKNNTISQSAINRALTILKDYRYVIEQYGVESVKIVATSAAREAKNREWFLGILKENGFEVKIIDDKKEALLTQLGISYFLYDTIINKEWIAFDLGGGSTEFMFSQSNRLVESVSIPYGAVKLLEMFVKHDPPKTNELEAVRVFFADQLKRYINFDKKIDFVVGNAGTVTSLSAINLNLNRYDFQKVEGYKLLKKDINSIFKELVMFNSIERLKRFKVLEKGREDVIVVGAVVVLSILEFFLKDYLITTNGSLREGLLLEGVC